MKTIFGVRPRVLIRPYELLKILIGRTQFDPITFSTRYIYIPPTKILNHTDVHPNPTSTDLLIDEDTSSLNCVGKKNLLVLRTCLQISGPPLPPVLSKL